MNRRAKNNMYLFWSIAIIGCVLLVFAALLFSTFSPAPPESLSSDSPDNVFGTVPPTGEPAAPGTAAPVDGPTQPAAPTDSVLLAETADAGQEYVDKLIFLGDSTTYGIIEYGTSHLSGGTNTTQIWTPVSGTLTLAYWSTSTIVYPDTGEEISIVDAVTRKQPEILVITLGVNGVSFMDQEYFSSEYSKLVNAVKAASPNTKIICNSIYPVMTTYQYYDQINNTNIPAANEWIKTVAQSTGSKYSDTASVLKADDGSLKAEYCNGDGLHLSSAGFDQVFSYLRTHAYQ